MNYLLVIVIILMILAIYSFLIGYHNIDLSVNAQTHQIDEGPFGTIRTTKELYLIGLKSLFISFWIYNIIVVILVFGLLKRKS